VRVLLTGAAGFIGARVAVALRAAGHDVVGVDALLPAAHGPNPVLPPGCHRVDVRDADALAPLLAGVDLVCHQAAMVGAGVDAADAPAYGGHNDLGTTVLLAQMFAAGVGRLVLASSMVVYGLGRYACPDHRRALLKNIRFHYAYCGEQWVWKRPPYPQRWPPDGIPDLPDGTLVEGIEKLPPGEWLEWIDGKISTGSYWRLPFGVDQNLTLESAKEELDALLQDAVREHLLSDVPLGVWLSGGIDSSTILHYAARASSSQLKTFSISFHGRSFDETEYVNRAAKQYNADHQELDLSPEQDLQGAIEEFAYYSDEPSADAGALPVWFLSKLCKTKTTVALSGEGADELFGGYLTYRANRLAARLRHLPRAIPQLALAAFRHWPASDEKISFEYKVKRFLEGALMPASRAHVYWNGTFSDAEKNSLLKQKLPNSLYEVLSQLDGLPPSSDNLAPYLWFDQKNFLCDDILTKSDRMSMAHSVEVRPPFLDHRLVEFAAKLPASLKIRGTQQKVLLKELMKDKLPPAILQRKKIGFDIPAHDWLRGPLRGLLTDSLRYGASECGELFQPEVINTFLQRHLAKKANVGYHLWGLMVLFLWMKKWRIQAASSETPGALAQARVGASI